MSQKHNYEAKLKVCYLNLSFKISYTDFSPQTAIHVLFVASVLSLNLRKLGLLTLGQTHR